MGFRVARGCLRSVLKMVNSVIGMAAIAMILFAFMYAFLGLGISFCIVNCSGHVAAETAHGHCLSCYMVFVFLLIMLEAAVTTDVLFNRQWEDAICIFLAVVLRGLGPDHGEYCDSDDDNISSRLPLLRNQIQQSYGISSSTFKENDFRNARIV